jgi:hypothetical protein
MDDVDAFEHMYACDVVVYTHVYTYVIGACLR